MSHDMVVRLGDTRYITPRAAADMADRTVGSIHRWRHAGVVESIKRAGKWFVREDDIIVISATTHDERESLGIGNLTPAEWEAKAEAWRLRVNSRLIDIASHHREEWTHTEMKALQELDELGIPSVEIAERLGRSYCAVAFERWRLKQEAVA